MFINESELKSVIYEYQLEEITESDESITLSAIASAEQELRSYLEANNQVRFKDGRQLLDLDAILSAVGNNRDPLLMTHCKTIALWYIIQLANVDIIHEQAKERYDRAVKWLRELGEGSVNLSTLPTLSADDPNNPNNKAPFVMGSRKKIRYE